MAHNPLAVNGGTGPTLWSHGAKQFGVFVDSADEIVACRFDHATRALEASFGLSGIAGNPLSLPLDTSDPHETAGLCVTPNGTIYVAGNNFNDTAPRMVRCNTSADITQAANWSDAASELADPATSSFTYWKFAAFANSVLLIYRIRHTLGGNDNPGESRAFRHAGTGWVDLGPVAFGDAGTEQAFYRNHIFVEPLSSPHHPNRGHLFGAWDFAFAGGIVADNFSYLYTDDEGSTWRNIAGTAVTLPISATNLAGQLVDTGISFGDPAIDNLYANGAAVDADGHPCGVYVKLTNPNQGQHIIRWDGSTWVDDTSTALRFAGGQLMNLVWFRGDLWTFGRPIFLGNSAMVELRRVAAPNETVHVAAPVGSGWYPYYDPVAYRETGVVEMLHVNGDVPRIVTFGNHARAEAA